MSCARPLIRVYNPNDHNITGSIMTLETYRKKASDNKAKKETEAGTTPKNSPYIGSNFGNYWKGKLEGGK